MRYDNFTYSLFKKKILALPESLNNYSYDMFWVQERNSPVFCKIMQALFPAKYKKYDRVVDQ